MPRLLLLLAILALVVAYFKFIAFAPRDVRRKRLQWSGYTLALGVLVVVVVRTGAVSAGVLGAVALAALRAAPALITWKRRLNGQQNEAEGSADRDSRHAAPRRASMSRIEALQVLELSGDPSRDEVMRRYRELMRHLHPDRGGSNYLAAKLNEARRVLLAD